MTGVLLLSGGLDSLVLLARECTQGRKPLCVTFSYGQRHQREIASAMAIARHYEAEHSLIGIPAIALHGSALTGSGDVPHAHYADPAQVATVVPNRNMVFLALAGALARQRGLWRVLFAAQQNDALIYADCRPNFVQSISHAMHLGCGISVEAPFLHLTKREVVQLGRELNAPLELSWSCYEGGTLPCGKCGACIERSEALTE